MRIVYLIRSIPYPNQRYVGLTSDLHGRLRKHNQGGSPHTAKFRPWELVTFIAFSCPGSAAAFETYLKSGSGRAFANKRLW